MPATTPCSSQHMTGATRDGAAPKQMSLEVPLFVDASCDAPVIKPIQKVVAADEDDGVSIGFEVSVPDHTNLKSSIV